MNISVMKHESSIEQVVINYQLHGYNLRSLGYDDLEFITSMQICQQACTCWNFPSLVCTNTITCEKVFQSKNIINSTLQLLWR